MVMDRVKVNQVYVAPMMDGRVLRRIRILAPHPDGGYIAKVLYSRAIGDNDLIYSITDLGLKKAYKLEVDVCEHRHTEDVYIDGGSNYPPSVPNYYQCPDCGDLFPNTGDTDLWFPKQLKKG
jgi:hypothetical protein